MIMHSCLFWPLPERLENAPLEASFWIIFRDIFFSMRIGLADFLEVVAERHVDELLARRHLVGAGRRIVRFRTKPEVFLAKRADDLEARREADRLIG